MLINQSFFYKKSLVDVASVGSNLQAIFYYLDGTSLLVLSY